MRHWVRLQPYEIEGGEYLSSPECHSAARRIRDCSGSNHEMVCADLRSRVTGLKLTMSVSQACSGAETLAMFLSA